MDKLKIVVQYTENGEIAYSFSEDVGPEYLDVVRSKFNPSENPKVDSIKILGAALMGMCSKYGPVGGSRETSIAITGIEQAVMWAVKSVTSGVD